MPRQRILTTQSHLQRVKSYLTIYYILTPAFRLMQVAPYNTFYPKLEAHLAQVGVDATVNKWDRILTLGTVNPHDAFIHPAGSTDVQSEGATLLQPEKFVTFSVVSYF